MKESIKDKFNRTKSFVQNNSMEIALFTAVGINVGVTIWDHNFSKNNINKDVLLESLAGKISDEDFETVEGIINK